MILLDSITRLTRAYTLTGKNLQLLTCDESQVWFKYQANNRRPTPQELDDDRFLISNNIITRYIGDSEIVTQIDYDFRPDLPPLMVNSDKIGTPCFMCRQVICEFFDEIDKVYVYSRKSMESFLVSELCPYPFNEDNL